MDTRIEISETKEHGVVLRGMGSSIILTIYKKTQEEEANFIQYENVKTDNMISDTQCLNGYPASSQSASQPPVSTTYDNIGRLTRLTDQAGTQTQFSYDHRGLVTQRTDAFGLNTNISYDKLGRVISQTDRNGSISSATLSNTPSALATTTKVNCNQKE